LQDNGEDERKGVGSTLREEISSNRVQDTFGTTWHHHILSCQQNKKSAISMHSESKLIDVFGKQSATNVFVGAIDYLQPLKIRSR
jgi:hypothetical protein